MRKTSIGFKISSVVVALLMFIALSGFVPIAVIGYKKATKFHTTKVQVQAAANEVYSAALAIIYDDISIELQRKDDKNMRVEGTRGKLEAVVEVKRLDNEKAEIEVKADAGKKAADLELALYITRRICDVMGIQYTVVEE